MARCPALAFSAAAFLAVILAGCGKEGPAAGGEPAAVHRSAANPSAGQPSSRPAASPGAPAAKAASAAEAPDEPTGKEIHTDSGLVYVNLVLGRGAPAQPGQRVRVHYTGTFEDGKKFDSSYDHPGGKPFEFVLGRSAVIKGWHEGIAGMRAGGKRKLIVPPQLGYGANSCGPIPGNSTLLFEVELVEIL